MSYKYTVNNGFLTKEQRDFYEKNGFIVVKKLIPQHELDNYHKRFVDICHKRVQDTVAMTIMKDVSLKDKQGVDPERIINKIQDYQADPILSKYFQLPEILKYVECFTGKDVAAVHTMLINKVRLSTTYNCLFLKFCFVLFYEPYGNLFHHIHYIPKYHKSILYGVLHDLMVRKIKKVSPV